MTEKIIENSTIVSEIVKGIQEKKGKKIVVVDMTQLSDAPCSYFVIGEGDSSTHVNALGNSVKEYLREKIKLKPYATDGFVRSEWIAMDYGQIMVHLFQREQRAYYDLEHLWEDAILQKIEDLS